MIAPFAILTVILVLSGTAIAAIGLGIGVYEQEVKRQRADIDADNVTTIEIKNRGSTIVRMWDEDHIHVYARITSSYEEVLDRVDLIHSKNPEVVIEVKEGKFAWNYHSKVEVSIPRTMDLQKLKMQWGDLDIKDIDSDIEVDVNTGDIYIHDIRGNVDLKCNSGDLDISDVTGDVKVRSSTSEIDIDRISGNVDLETDTSSIDIRDVYTVSNINSDTGSIYLQVRNVHPDGSSVTSNTGEIRVRFLQPLNCNLTADVGTGEIHTNDITVTTEVLNKDDKYIAHMGTGGPDFVIKTNTGNINLHGGD